MSLRAIRTMVIVAGTFGLTPGVAQKKVAWQKYREGTLYLPSTSSKYERSGIAVFHDSEGRGPFADGYAHKLAQYGFPTLSVHYDQKGLLKNVDLQR